MKRRAFSLIEVVLALGVISFALVGIMGLFPVALRSAQDSQRETRATFIAQQIFSDIKALPGSNTMIVTGTNLLADRINVNLANAATNVVVFSDAGVPVGTVPESTFVTGTSVSNAAFLAKVILSPNVPATNLTRVQTTIETPAVAAATNRSRYTFVTILRQ